MGESLNLGPRITGDHHYALLEHVLPMCAGTAVEFGTGSGESGQLIAKHMPLITFGSEEGLPEDWRPGFEAGSFAYPTPEICGALIVAGWFTDTLPGFDFGAFEPIGLVHFDADLYSSTATALEHIGPHLTPGTIVVFDEYHGFDGAERYEYRAWTEWTNLTGIDYTPIGHDFEQAAFEIA